MIKHYTEPVIRTRGLDLTKRWYVEFYCASPDTKEMERFQYHCGVNRVKNKAKRLEDLKRWRNDFADLLFSGWSPFSTDRVGLPVLAENNLPVPLGRSLEAVLLSKADKSEDTVRSYKSIAKLFQDYIKKYYPSCNDSIADIGKKQVRAYSQYLKSVKKYASKTHNNHLSVLSSFFKEFILNDFIEANPFDVVRLMPVDKTAKRVHKPFDDVARAKITAYLEQHDPELLLFQKCIFYFAVRPKELRLLKVWFFDMKRNTVTIPATDGGDRIAKTGQTRTIAIPKNFLADLQGLHLSRIKKEGYLFSPDGLGGAAPYSKDVMNRRFNKVRKALNIPDGYTNYGYKHTAADALFDLPAIDEKDIQQHFRHSSLDQTKAYARNRGKRLAPALAKHYPKF